MSAAMTGPGGRKSPSLGLDCRHPGDKHPFPRAPKLQEKEKIMRPDLSRAAVLSIDKGEEIFGGWATAPIPQVGSYKLLAKKTADGTIEWAHFVQRDSGAKERVLRGAVKTPEEFTVVQDAINGNLQRIYGVTLRTAGYDCSTLDGKKATGTRH
jgi:hypothetical protein